MLIILTINLKKILRFGIIRKNLKPIKEYKMKVTLEQVRDNLAKLTIEVSKEEFAIALDKAFEKVVKEVKIDGFRPGKCPKSMFIKRFGYESLYEDFSLQKSLRAKRKTKLSGVPDKATPV